MVHACVSMGASKSNRTVVPAMTDAPMIVGGTPSPPTSDSEKSPTEAVIGGEPLIVSSTESQPDKEESGCKGPGIG